MDTWGGDWRGFQADGLFFLSGARRQHRLGLFHLVLNEQALPISQCYQQMCVCPGSCINWISFDSVWSHVELFSPLVVLG